MHMQSMMGGSGEGLSTQNADHVSGAHIRQRARSVTAERKRSSLCAC